MHPARVRELVCTKLCNIFDTVVIIASYQSKFMSEEKLGFVGKQVKDIYGTYIGRVVGLITEIDGEIETASVDCGSGGLKQLPYEQLVIQGDYVFFIPRWRLEAQKLLRQKSLTLKRIKALQEIVSENDSMKEDAELVYLKYDRKLHELEEQQKSIDAKLDARIGELDSESKNVKGVLFDAKLQFRSNEMREETYQQIKIQTDELLEHITNEKTEISNVRAKLAAQTIENISGSTAESTPTADVTAQPANTAESQAPVAAAVTAEGHTESIPIVTAVTTPEAEAPAAEQTTTTESSWLNQVIQKQ